MKIRYIIFDGDDIGRRITSAFLKNNAQELLRINALVADKTNMIAEILARTGFKVLFKAADGVVAQSSDFVISDNEIFDKVISRLGDDITFSAGVGLTLRECYTALLAAKSGGKACIVNFSEI
jgi:hypothetical protein